MPTSQHERAARFRALHDTSAPFLIPNPWDRGSAKLLAHMGFDSLATTSLGAAIALGRKRACKQELLANLAQICEATPLPVNADLENGFGDAPEEAAASIALAYECGAVGASIEDGTYDPRMPIYEFNLAVERVAAAVEAAKALPVPIMLTARADNWAWGVRDLDDTIRRLQAFEAAGADVLYAPGLKTLDQMNEVVAAVSKPVNVVMGLAEPSITLEQLAKIGVRRVSIGGALARLAMRTFLEGAGQMRNGEFRFVEDIADVDELHASFD